MMRGEQARERIKTLNVNRYFKWASKSNALIEAIRSSTASKARSQDSAQTAWSKTLCCFIWVLGCKVPPVKAHEGRF
jgi:hypothetical protein